MTAAPEEICWPFSSSAFRDSSSPRSTAGLSRWLASWRNPEAGRAGGRPLFHRYRHSTRAALSAEVVGFRATGYFSCLWATSRTSVRDATFSPWSGPWVSVWGTPFSAASSMDLETLSTTGARGGFGFYPLYAEPPHPLRRKMITSPLPVGVKVIDGLLTLGTGQRIGIFAGSGVGKSTLLAMMARYTEADVNVIALVGERGRKSGNFSTATWARRGAVRCSSSPRPTSLPSSVSRHPSPPPPSPSISGTREKTFFS